MSLLPDHEAFRRKTQHLAAPVAELLAELVEAVEADEAVKAVGSDLRISKPAPRFFAHFQCTVVRSPKVRRDRLRMTNFPLAELIAELVAELVEAVEAAEAVEAQNW